MRRIARVIVMFPRMDAGSRRFFAVLASLPAGLPGSTVSPGRIHLVPGAPAGVLPDTTYETGEVAFPAVRFATDAPIELSVGAFTLWNDTRRENGDEPAPALAAFEEPGGRAGDTSASSLPLDALAARLFGHLVRVDHTGFNLPAAHVGLATWNRLLETFGGVSNLYGFPGEEWPFILPATEDEFERNIERFPRGRNPRVELVYDHDTPEPILQFALVTDLARSELEARLPEPYGLTLPGLEAFWRTVFVGHPWTGLRIRFDLRYKDENPDSDWDSGRFFVRQGRRIRG